jgi:site-specific recombinase XerD
MPSSPFLRSISDYMRVRGYSLRTIKSYLYWIRYFILFNNKNHPGEIGARQVEAFLTYLAVDRHVSPSTQSAALNAVAFLYNRFLDQPLGDMGQFSRPTRQRKLPVVLTTAEMTGLLDNLSGVRSRLTSSRPGRTSARFSRNSAMPTSRRPRSIPMCSDRAPTG